MRLRQYTFFRLFNNIKEVHLIIATTILNGLQKCLIVEVLCIPYVLRAGEVYPAGLGRVITFFALLCYAVIGSP
jgi:hypothetical protein